MSQVAQAGTSSALAMMHARRPGMRAEDRDRLAGLHDERLVVLEAAQRGDDGVERRPAARRASRAAVDDEVVGPLGHLGIEVVHQHPQRGFLRPSLAGERRAARRADVAAEDVHVDDRSAASARASSASVKDSNLKTYARVVKLKLKNFLLDFSRARAIPAIRRRSIAAIASMSGDGGRSSASVGTTDRTRACTRCERGDVVSGASRSSAWHAQQDLDREHARGELRARARP